MTVREREVNRIPDDLGEIKSDIATGAANLDQWLAKQRDAICRGMSPPGMAIPRSARARAFPIGRSSPAAASNF